MKFEYCLMKTSWIISQSDVTIIGKCPSKYLFYQELHEVKCKQTFSTSSVTIPISFSVGFGPFSQRIRMGLNLFIDPIKAYALNLSILLLTFWMISGRFPKKNSYSGVFKPSLLKIVYECISLLETQGAKWFF